MSTGSNSKDTSSLTYRQAGVDVDAGNALVDRIKPLAASTKRVGADADLGGFGGLFDLAACKFKDPVLVSANDGVGTKLKIAIDAGAHDFVGIDLVAMCVNDLIVQGAEPLFFLDYIATRARDIDEAATVIAGIADGCRQAGAALIGGETAEMPGLYAKGDYDLAGFAVGAVERDKILPKADLKAGDVLIALGSDGVHSNGFSLVRKVVEREGLAFDAPCPWQTEQTLGENLLTPTRIYVKPVLAALKQSDGMKALAHITGGGITENLPRVMPKHLDAAIDLDAITMAPVFHWLAEKGRIEQSEMLRTFNCGVGMIAVVSAEKANEVIAVLNQEGVTAYAIGHMKDGSGDVTYQGDILK